MIAVENNSIGWAVLDKLKENEYPNLYYSYKSSHDYVDPITAEGKANAIVGFSTTLKTRPLLIAKMEEFIRNKLITIYSRRLYNEMKTFIWNNSKPQAMKGYNDDLVMACAIGCWVKDMAFETSQKNLEYQKAFLNSMKRCNTELNTTIPGQKGYTPLKKTGKIKNNEDFLWLLKG